MRNRFDNAYLIQQGACSPSGIARALVDACDEARSECSDTESVCNDSAVRLIVHQLAHLINLHVLDRDLSAYGRLVDECWNRSAKTAN